MMELMALNFCNLKLPTEMKYQANFYTPSETCTILYPKRYLKVKYYVPVRILVQVRQVSRFH